MSEEWTPKRVSALIALWNDGEKIYPTLSKVDLARELIELTAEHLYSLLGSETHPTLTIM